MIRGPLSTASKLLPMVDTATLELATQWFDRIGTVDQIRSAMKKRFGYGITKTSDGYETYKRGEMTAEIDAGFYEAIDVGISNRIVSALAQLFTRSGSAFTVVGPTGEVDVDGTAFLGEIRSQGGFAVASSAADRMACAVESAAIRVRWDEHTGGLVYEPVAPQNLKLLYPQYIEEADSGERYPDYARLEDAAAVIVRLSGQADSRGEHRWIAYIGANTEYPSGRCVSYAAKADGWHEIPPIGTPGSRDVLLGEEPVNPLTYAQQLGGYASEYPLVIVRGGHISAQVDPMPTMTALYDSCVELTLAWSRLLKDSLSGMLGREVLKNPDAVPLPDVTEGVIALKRGQEYEVKTMNSGSVTAAVDAIYASCGAVAAGWNVPPYTVVSRLGSAPESGIALVVQTAPLVQFLEHRDSVNAEAMERLFDIERGLLDYHEGITPFFEGSTVTWTPGTLRTPQDETVRTQAIIQQLDAGLIDAVEAVRQLSGYETSEEAEAELERRRERAGRIGRVATQAQAQQPPVRPGLPPRVR